MTNDISQFYQSIPTHKAQSEYLAFFSSYTNTYTTDPKLMMVPIDDHIVHRGDGVFEAFKVVNKKMYLFNEHMERLHQSAERIGLSVPKKNDELKSICEKLISLSKNPEGIFRFYLSRGPGKFSTNPSDSIGAQIYIVYCSLIKPDPKLFSEGATLGLSKFHHKEPFFAQIKSCNYLLNVLMKKEAVERNLHFTITLTQDNFVAEGSTENICIVNDKNEIHYPSFKYTLAGTTLKRLIKLSPQLISQKKIAGIFESNLSLDDIKNAAEIFMIGTTLDALPVTQFEGKSVGNGKPGAISKIALEAIQQDQLTGS